MRPEEWRAVQPGMGSCFHQALHRWADLRTQGDIWKVAIGVVEPNEHDPVRHLHAWLERDPYAMSAVSGDVYYRAGFYKLVGIERRTIALVNPRSIMRARKGVIDKETVAALLNASGLKWRVVNGGVLPVDIR